MELSLIQKDILITLITLYHQQSHSIKGEEIAEMIMRNPGTVRNQMQSLKAVGLVDGVPGPKGGYIPTELAYKELNLNSTGGDYDVPISRDGEEVRGVHVQEIDFTTALPPGYLPCGYQAGGQLEDIRDRRQDYDWPDSGEQAADTGRGIRERRGQAVASHCHFGDDLAPEAAD